MRSHGRHSNGSQAVVGSETIESGAERRAGARLEGMSTGNANISRQTRIVIGAQHSGESSGFQISKTKYVSPIQSRV